ncbi:MAG: BON domain-containing protein [Terriglobia bacterium]
MKALKFLAVAMLVGLASQTAFASIRDSDAKRAAELQDKIYHAKVFNHGQVQTTFKDGVATLTGTVDNLGAKLDAEKAARKSPGVSQVINNIQVKAEDVSSQQILDQARHEILTYYAYGIFDNINLEAQGNKLVVSGQVTQPFKKSDIGNFLTRVRGVAKVENDLEVLPVSNFDDRLRIQLARAIYGDPFFVHYANRSLPPIHIIVKNGNVTLEGAVATKLDSAKAEMAARTTGLSFSVVNNLRVDRG